MAGRHNLDSRNFSFLVMIFRTAHFERGDRMTTKDQTRETGPWGRGGGELRDWDPAWAETCVKMSINPWSSGVLSAKSVELVGVALNASCTNLNPDGLAGTFAPPSKQVRPGRDLDALKMPSDLRSIRAASAPRYCSKRRKRRVKPMRDRTPPTPACDKMRAVGQWNEAWNPFFELDPLWTDEFMAGARPLRQRADDTQRVSSC